MSPPKVNLYNLSDLKNASDDAIANYLSSLNFTQTHTLTNTRLALGYTAFTLAAACFAWDYHYGFPSTKHITAAAVLLYLLLNGALTYWIYFVEEGTIYAGVTPSGEKLYISTAAKHEPVYKLKVAIFRGKDVDSFEIEKPFAEFYDESGYFCVKPFQEFLAGGISLVGKADPKRVRSAADVLEETPGLLDAVIDAQASGVEKSSGGKRRKV